MATCEKCWGDAYLRSLWNGKDQPTNYHEILAEREASGEVCSQIEQDGQFYEKRQAERESA